MNTHEKLHEEIRNKFEIPEKIWEKIRDINLYGTAYTVLGATNYESASNIIDSGVLENILKYGLLGQSGFYENGEVFVNNGEKKPITPNNWVQNIRSGRNTLVFFNIIGRGFNHTGKKINIDKARAFDRLSPDNQDFLTHGRSVFEGNQPGSDISMHTKMTDSYWLKQEHSQIILTFDISKFQEEREVFYLSKDYPESEIPSFYSPNSPFYPYNQKTELKVKQKTYLIPVPPVSWKEKHQFITINNKGETAVRTDYGFALNARIAPRFLNGVVIKPANKANHDTQNEQSETYQLTEKIIQMMKKIYRNKPELILPIYDIEGNLLYPEKT